MVTGDFVRRLGPAPVHGAALVLVALATAGLVLMLAHRAIIEDGRCTEDPICRNTWVSQQK